MTILETINAQARARAVRLDEVDWQRPIDASKLWVPPELCPLAYTRLYESLGPAERLADNHIYACSLAEQFIFLEEGILNRVVTALRAARGFRAPLAADPALAEALGHLFDEEEVHTEMFWRLLERAAPEHYPERRFRLIPVTRARLALVRWIFGRPLLFPFWAWVGALFEEKTIYFSRLYERLSDAEVDATFARVHRLHMIDEARHFALEREMVARLWRGLPAWQRGLNLRLLQSFLRSFIGPVESSLLRFDILSKQFPNLKARRAELRAELERFPENASWLAAAFSPEVLPGCFRMFAEHPEVAALMSRLTAPRPRA